MERLSNLALKLHASLAFSPLPVFDNTSERIATQGGTISGQNPKWKRAWAKR